VRTTLLDCAAQRGAGGQQALLSDELLERARAKARGQWGIRKRPWLLAGYLVCVK
jgi:hypothetical protein